MRKWLLGMAVLAAVAAAGCSKSAACVPVEGGVGVCLNGTPIEWSAGSLKPHMHENGGYYASAEDLARALDVKITVSADKKSVKVGAVQVTARTENPKGIHMHDAKVFVPIREFAEAAGYKADVDNDKHTVNIYR